MLLTITTTYKPATDLAYLLHKSPFRCQAAPMPFGMANLFFPETTKEKCTFAVPLDIEPPPCPSNSTSTAGPTIRLLK
jgi:hypothetical protein